MNTSFVSPLHVAIITDGNGRWGTSRGLPRAAGHRAGAENLRRILSVAPELNISTLTLYAFSANNWQRPASEVNVLMQLLHDYLIVETPRCVERGIRVSVIGRRDRISPALREAAESAELATERGQRLHLRLAVDYSSREMLYRAACRFYKVTDVSRESQQPPAAAQVRVSRRGRVQARRRGRRRLRRRHDLGKTALTRALQSQRAGRHRIDSQLVNDLKGPDGART